MKFGLLIFCVVLTGGCSLRRERATLPPPPVPSPPTTTKTAQSTPPKPAEPLSMPQTDVRLPEPQPISPEALATIQKPAESSQPAAEPESPKPPRRVGPIPPPNTKLEPETEAQAEPLPTTPAEPRLQTLVSAEERNRLAKEIAAKRGEIEKLLGQLGPNPRPEKTAGVERVASFLTLANQLAERGDIRQADALTTRALLLARDLVEGR